MQINTYTKKLILICAALIVAIAGFSYILYNQGPRVRFVQGLDSLQNQRLTINSNLQIVFDRPIEQKDYSQFIGISPEVDFKTNTNAQSITVTLQNNLQSNTDYTLSVSPQIYDKPGKKMRSAYQKSFTTGRSSYIYLERNYELDFDNLTLADDHIKLSTIDSEPEILFSHPQIRSFAANNDYLVIAVKESVNDDLYTIDLDTREVRKEELGPAIRINNLALSQRSQTALLTTLPEFSQVSPEYFNEFANKLESVNLADGTTTVIADSAGDTFKAFGIDTDIDGQIALVHDASQTYYAVSPFNDFDPVIIGSYSETFGFSKRGTEIVFRDNENLVRYDITTAEIIPIEPFGTGFVLDVQSQNDVLSLSSTVYSPLSSYTSIDRFDDWGQTPSTVWENLSTNSAVLKEFSPSYDNKIQTVQFYPDNCDYDDFGSNSECKASYLKFIDSETGDIIKEFRGSSFVWLP